MEGVPAPGDHARLSRLICEATGASHARSGARVASLWSGYGEIRRYSLEGAALPSVIVKHVAPPVEPAHARGWGTDRSHERKLRSYAVEQHFYARFASRCEAACRLPRSLHLAHEQDRFLFVLEDLDAAGYPVRRTRLSRPQLKACLDWLAHFHACFLTKSPSGLWQEGTYWHLDTRPDELSVMEDVALREAAPQLDRRLRDARHRSLVHGDAKLANFCFGDATEVAALDFQYVGGGVGVKDVAYFFSSCLTSEQCEAQADALLEHYFERLSTAVGRWHPQVDTHALEREWRALYPVAWADFTRFLLGWAPDHAKLHAYSLGLTRRVLREL